MGVLLVLWTAAALPAHAGRAVHGVVRSVYDGDTVLLVAGDGERIRARLYGIDAPEVRHREIPGQPYGQEARRVLREKLLKRRVRLEIRETDEYGREVGIVELDGRNINEEMVREGYAWAYRRYLERPYASPFIEAEAKARAERRGLWRQPLPTPPWEFRRAVRRGR